MKKIYLGLITATMLAGCSTASNETSTSQVEPLASVSASGNLIQDPQLTEFRRNNGKSDFWIKQADKKNGLGDVGSSKDTAFGEEGSARLRFISASDDFSAQPALVQKVTGLAPNTEYTFSFYYYDKKGNNSPTELLVGLKDSMGKTLASKTVHASDVASNPQGEVKKGFKLVTMNFNSGSHTSAELYAKLKLTDPSSINKSGDIGKQTEVRVDEFKLIQQ